MKKMVNDEQIDFPSYLRLLRSSAGLSQGDVAKTMGYSSAQFVSNWERGLSVPPASAFEQLAKAFKIPYDELAAKFIAFSLKNFETELHEKLFSKSGRSRPKIG